MMDAGTFEAARRQSEKGLSNESSTHVFVIMMEYLPQLFSSDICLVQYFVVATFSVKILADTSIKIRVNPRKSGRLKGVTYCSNRRAIFGALSSDMAESHNRSTALARPGSGMIVAPPPPSKIFTSSPMEDGRSRSSSKKPSSSSSSVLLRDFAGIIYERQATIAPYVVQGR